MEIAEYQAMFEAEGDYWWYVGMRRITASILGRRYLAGSGLRILDAGSGTGAMLIMLSRYGETTGIDFSPEALRLSRIRNLPRLVQGTIEVLPFRDGVFDLVTSFDVLYHLGVHDDQNALAEFARVLKPGGRALIRVPAYDWLRSRHDRAVHTRHRYTAGELRRKVQGAGLHCELVSYANTLLFPIAVGSRLAEGVLALGVTSQPLHKPPPPAANALLRTILTVEAPLVSSIGLPFGLSVFCLARKPAPEPFEDPGREVG